MSELVQLSTRILVFIAIVTPGLKSVAQMNGSLPVTPPPNGALCWDQQQQLSMPPPSLERFIREVGRVEGLYLALQPIQDLPLLGGGTYQAEVSAKVPIRLQLYSNDPAQTYRVFVLVDEQPLYHDVEGERVYYYDVVLTPDMTAPQNVDFETPELSEGIHDIVVAVTTHTDVPQAFNTSFERGLRISIVAGKPQLRDLSFQRLEATAVPPDAEIHRRLGLALPNQTRYWIEEEPVTLPSGELLSFDILRGYVSHRINSEAPDLPQPALDRFAIIAFIDGEPVPLDEDFTLYAEVTADTLAARIPVQVPQPLSAGEHELVVVSIPHPGIPMCQLFGPPNGYFFSSQPEYTWSTFHVTE